jgi:hypothetical protein
MDPAERKSSSAKLLVAVNVRYCHHIHRALQMHPEMSVVKYPEL